MAEAIPSGVARKIIELLGSTTFKEIGSIWGVKDDLEKLKNTVSTVQAVFQDADELQDKNHQVKDWLMKLRDAVYDADDLLTDFSTQDLRRRVMGGDKMANKVRTFFSSSNQLVFRLKMAHKLKAIRERLDAIANNRNNFQFVEVPLQVRAVTRERDQTHSFISEEEVIGREEDKKNLIDLLLNYDVEENVSFISIVGIGGIGKTTLAQYVYNDENVKTYFELHMWVYVSDVFDVKTIAEKIIGCATGIKPINLEMDQLQIKLREILNQKKYLLFLDDVWNENVESWCNLKKFLLGGLKGSKVVITTRIKLVAEITSTISPIFLEGLSENKSWSLLKQMAFKKGQETIDLKLKAIGMDIVQKCCGVPLAIKTIGRILYFKETEDEWSYIKDKELLDVTQGENDSGILSILKLSYNHLPLHLKCCFAYCSLFPKDHEISKLTLIQLWIAQGFIQSSNKKLRLEDVANEYFMDLLWRSFFQKAREDCFGNIVSFKMHDLIHDLAQSISNIECTLVDSNAENVNENVRHLSIAFEKVFGKNLSLLFKAKKVRTFILTFTSWIDLNKNLYEDLGKEELARQKSTLKILFSSFGGLRALDLHGLSIVALPHSIDKLVYLKYLDLSKNKIEVLPGSIIRLLNLQILNLSDCSRLKELPENIQKLANLRCLEINGCHSLTHMPLGLGQLTSLQVLPLFIMNQEPEADFFSKYCSGLAELLIMNKKHRANFFPKHCGSLAELNKLNNLRGELCIIINLERVKNAASEAKAANLKDKPHLRRLKLRWDRQKAKKGKDVKDVRNDENLMKGLRPHPNLKNLSVEWYKGVRFPSWLASLTNLVELEISKSKCNHLPPMYQLPCLRDLSLKYMPNLKHISNREISDEISSSTAFFPSLESLELSECPNLKGWWRRDITDVPTVASTSTSTSSHQHLQHVSLPYFPRLSRLEIWGCRNLTCMPLFPYLEKFQLTYASSKPLQQTMAMPMNMTATSSHSFSSYPSPSLSKLKSLYLIEIQDLEFLAEQWLQNLASLENLTIEACAGLKSLPLSRSIQHLTSLKSLEIRGCEEVDLFSDDEIRFVSVTSLQTLKISDVLCLITLPVWIGNLTSLQDLEIERCPNLISLPEGIGNLSSLRSLIIFGCPRLKEGYLNGGEAWRKIAHAPYFQISNQYASTSLGRIKTTERWPRKHKRMAYNCLRGHTNSSNSQI